MDIETTLMWVKNNIREITVAKERMIEYLISNNHINPLYDRTFLANCDIMTIIENVEHFIKNNK